MNEETKQLLSKMARELADLKGKVRTLEAKMSHDTFKGIKVTREHSDDSARQVLRDIDMYSKEIAAIPE